MAQTVVPTASELVAPPRGGRPGVLLDRDGVLVAEGQVRGPLVPLPGVAEALRVLNHVGLPCAVVTNQPIIARGELTVDDVAELHAQLNAALEAQAPGAAVSLFLVCPHHPNADRRELRVDCACRKPRPGLLFAAARRLDLDLSRTIVVGDRLSDLHAGELAGCRTVLVRSSETAAPPIQSGLAWSPSAVRVDETWPSLSAWVRRTWPT